MQVQLFAIVEKSFCRSVFPCMTAIQRKNPGCGMESLFRLIQIAALCTSSSNMANPGGTYLVISNHIIKKDRMLPVHSSRSTN
jgi:hypothetical protein